MQSRLGSLIEALANVAIGYLVAVVTQLLVFPVFGLVVSLGENLAISAIFTVVSIARSYLLRRLFNLLHRQRPVWNSYKTDPIVRRSTIFTRARPGEAGFVEVKRINGHDREHKDGSASGHDAGDAGSRY